MIKNLATTSIFAVLSICISISSCSKTQGGSNILKSINGEPVIPRDANRIIIPFFHNYTTRSAISEKLTLHIRRFVSMDARLAVVTDDENADLRLIGSIVKYQVQPVQYGDFREPIKKRLRIIASLRLYNNKEKKEIFYDSEVQAFEIFSDLVPPVSSEIHVSDRVLEKLARRITVKVIDGWYTELMTPVEKGKK